MVEDPIMRKKSSYIHDRLKEIGVENVYIDPPENLIMKYPCARVRLNNGRARYADNKTHIFTPNWEIIHIGYEPDDEIVPKMMHAFKQITYQRHYTANNLHHNLFTLYY